MGSRLPGFAEWLATADVDINVRRMAVCGVGCWAVEILLVFAQFHPQILPVNALRIHKGLQLTYGTRAPPAYSQWVFMARA